MDNIDFYFMPIDELTCSTKIPTLLFSFAGQCDFAVENRYPAVGIMRKRMDNMHSKENMAFFQLNPIQRDGKTTLLGVMYVDYPWKKKKNWDADDVNFYSTVHCRTVDAVTQLRAMGFDELVILLPSKFHPRSIESDTQKEKLFRFVRTVTEAVCYANGEDVFKKNPRKPIKIVTFTYFGAYNSSVGMFFKKAIFAGKTVGRTLLYTRHLIELPPNMKLPSLFLTQAVGKDARFRSIKRIPKRLTWHKVANHNFSRKTSISIIHGIKSLEAYGFNMIAGVGQGSTHEPFLMKVHYKPRTKRQTPVKRVVLVGKGVTFDTGGLDLKGTGYFDKMHYDMAGAATVLGIIRIAERYNLAVEVIALVPVAHNAIGSHAIDPHTVLTAFDGQTVEVINTDAEGRLILADALAYSKTHLRADATVSVATLGGLEVVAPDIIYALASTPAMERKMLLVREEVTEKLVLSPPLEYLNCVDNALDGTTTDLVNLEETNAYSSEGMVFLSNFVDPLGHWVHIDISALFDPNAPNNSVGPGLGLRTLWYFVKSFA